MARIPIIVCGAAGRMGTLILQIAARDPQVSIAGAVECPGHEAVGRQIAPGVSIADRLPPLLGAGQVVVDFTSPEATVESLKAAVDAGSPFVSGTTGLAPAQSAAVNRAAQTIPVLHAPNMSFGVACLDEILALAARLLRNYEVEITEVHHHGKKDAPSGTALMLARTVCRETGRDGEQNLVYGRQGTPGPRPAGEIGIHAIRMGDVVGEHSVFFAGEGEIIEISHRCSNRAAFAGGAVRAAKFLYGRKPGLYSMKNVLTGESNG